MYIKGMLHVPCSMYIKHFLYRKHLHIYTANQWERLE